MSSFSAISSTLMKRTIPLCSVSKTSSSYNTTPLFLSLKNPIFPNPPQSRILHARLMDSPNEYPTRSPPEFSPPVPDFDQPSVPPEVPGISTSPEVDIPATTPPEVSPYPPSIDPDPSPGPDFPVPPLKPPPAPDVPGGPFPDNPIPGPDILPPQPPDVVPPRPPGPEIIPPPAPPPPPTGPGGPIII